MLLLLLFDDANGLRHGRPLLVMPLHVAEASLESDRGNFASGVRACHGCGEDIVMLIEVLRPEYESSIFKTHN